jgi:hypothetical protein
MKGKSALMAGVAAVALIATAQAGIAGKANADGMSNSSATSAGVSQDQYDQLSQRVDALEAELQQSEIHQAADHEAVSAWKPMAGWWDNTTISGRMYFDVTNLNNKNNGVASSSNGTSFDVKRFYLGIDHKFDEVFSANLTTDVAYVSSDNVSQIYIKKAYLQAKLDPAFIVRVGSADMPWIPYAEGVYGYRFVENTLVDRTHFGNSADWGVYVLGDLADGLVSYEFTATTGAGYKKLVRTNSPDFEGRISLNYQGLTLAIGGYDGKLGVQHGTATFHTAQRFDAMGSYTISGLKVGIEYFHADNWTQVTSATSSSADGYSPFASYQFDPKWSVFGRYDYVTPYSDVARKMYHNTYYNLGIDYKPTKIVDIALVYKHDAGSNGFFGDSNGTIGGNAFAMGNSGADNEIGLWGDFQW